MHQVIDQQRRVRNSTARARNPDRRVLQPDEIGRQRGKVRVGVHSFIGHIVERRDRRLAAVDVVRVDADRAAQRQRLLALLGVDVAGEVEGPQVEGLGVAGDGHAAPGGEGRLAGDHGVLGRGDGRVGLGVRGQGAGAVAADGVVEGRVFEAVVGVDRVRGVEDAGGDFMVLVERLG